MKSVLFLLALFPVIASATDMLVECAPPTTRVDGKAISGALSFNLFGAKKGEPKSLLTPTPLTECKSLRKNVLPGTWCWDWIAIEARPDMGPNVFAESDHNVEACRIVSPMSPPKIPGDTSATIVTTSTVAYKVTDGNNRLTFLIVGTVPLGTPCDSAQTVNGFNVIPRESVTWDGPAKPLTVVARCGSPT